MKTNIILLFALLIGSLSYAQSEPVITSWLINTTGITGRHYIQGNANPIEDDYPANVQSVQFGNNFVYPQSSGIPAYIIGPYLDGNPALASDNQWLWAIPRNPQVNTGTPVSTPLGPIGVFINGVPMYDYKDAASYSQSLETDVMGGPGGGGSGDGVWNRNAILAENDGFDCAKGHPSPVFSGGGPGGGLAGGIYHHHQNPSAFNLDLITVSDICDTYLADGLYTIQEGVHAPLIGFAFDGYPVYGAFGYENPLDPNSQIVRMQSSFVLRDISERNSYADGTLVLNGPDVSQEYPLGWYREDFEFIDGAGHLDEHNGRFCVTPEFPNGTYAYFATIDENWNSAFPYLIGSSYYGVVETSNFSGMNGNTVEINETVETYDPSTTVLNSENGFSVNTRYQAYADLILVQINGVLDQDLAINLYDLTGKLVLQDTMVQGSTIWHLDTQSVYAGNYIVQFKGNNFMDSIQLSVSK